MPLINKKNKAPIIIGGIFLGLAGLTYYNRKKVKAVVSGYINPKNNSAHIDSLNPQFKDKFQRFLNAAKLRFFLSRFQKTKGITY